MDHPVPKRSGSAKRERKEKKKKKAWHGNDRIGNSSGKRILFVHTAVDPCRDVRWVASEGWG